MRRNILRFIIIITITNRDFPCEIDDIAWCVDAEIVCTILYVYSAEKEVSTWRENSALDTFLNKTYLLTNRSR